MFIDLENIKILTLGWQDSNLRMAESKSTALPLGDTPILRNIVINIK